MRDTRERDEYGRPKPLFAAMRWGCDIRPTTRQWLWPGRIPRGAVTVLAGDPGSGKSILTVDIAARVTTGRGWVCEEETKRREGEETERRRDEETKWGGEETQRRRDEVEEKRARSDGAAGAAPAHSVSSSLRLSVSSPLPPGVVFVSAEDSPDDVLLPRLAAAGANTNRCKFVEGVSHTPSLPPATMPGPHEIQRLQLPDHIETLAEAVGTIKDANPLVILDPVTSFMAAGTSVGKVFGSLTRLAQDYNLAVLAVCHLSKARAYRALYRVRGSLEYVSVARSVMLLSVDQTDPERRVLHHIKSAYGPPGPPLAFRLRGDATVAWEDVGRRDQGIEGLRDRGQCELSAEFLDLPAERQTAIAEARDWLEEFLKNGPRVGEEVRRAARGAGISQATLYRARFGLGVRAERGEWRMTNGECRMAKAEEGAGDT